MANGGQHQSGLFNSNILSGHSLSETSGIAGTLAGAPQHLPHNGSSRQGYGNELKQGNHPGNRGNPLPVGRWSPT